MLEFDFELLLLKFYIISDGPGQRLCPSLFNVTLDNVTCTQLLGEFVNTRHHETENDYASDLLQIKSQLPRIDSNIILTEYGNTRPLPPSLTG